MSAEPETVTPATQPAPAELNGLRGARLAARVRQALYRTPPARLADAFRRMREGATARHLDYFMDGVVQTIRVFPCPITVLPSWPSRAALAARECALGLYRSSG